MKIRIVCLIVLMVSSFFIHSANSAQEKIFLISQAETPTQQIPVVPSTPPFQITPVPKQSPRPRVPRTSPSPLRTKRVTDKAAIIVINGPKADVLNNERFLIIDVKQGTQIDYTFRITDKNPNQKIVPKVLYLPVGSTFKLQETDTIINDNPENKSFPPNTNIVFSWKPNKSDQGFHPVKFLATNSLRSRAAVIVYFYVHN